MLDDHALQRVHSEGFAPIFAGDADRHFDSAVATMKDGLAVAISEVFLIATATMFVGFLISFLLKDVPLRTSYEMPSAFEAAPEGEAPKEAVAGPSITAPPLRDAQKRASIYLDRTGAP